MVVLNEQQREVLQVVKEFVERDIRPRIRDYEPTDLYPWPIVERMRELGLFGLTVPVDHGGLGLDFVTFALVFEEISAAWMSAVGPLGPHSVMIQAIKEFATEQQRQRFLPRMATGELRGALALTEPHAGSDVQNIRTVAIRDGDDYVLRGRKAFITNALNGTVMLVIAKTDPQADPPARGISAFVLEHTDEVPGLTIQQPIKKLGYKCIDTCEIAFDDVRVRAGNLVGEVEGQGFRQVMSGLEVGRINVAARAVGVARAAFEDAVRYAQQRQTFGKPIHEHQHVQALLADMYTSIQAARLLVLDAAEKKSQGGRADLEAGVAKLFASEMCAKVTLDAMRVHGGYGYTADANVERYYRDAPLMIIGEGTSEIQRTLIARQLVRRYAVT